MSNKLQDNQTTRAALILVIVAIIGFTGWFVTRDNNNGDKPLENTENVQATTEAEDTYKDWADQAWESQSLAFKRPSNWVVEERASMGRFYIKNADVDLLKQAAPHDFQQLWISVDTDENSAAREAAIKEGRSAYRVVRGEVKASTIDAGDLKINTYEYQTVGGPTLEAYWTNKDGKRYYATNSTEMGEDNQTEMVAALKKLLASIELK